MCPMKNISLAMLGLTFILSACTGKGPPMRLAQQEETFASTGMIDVNTRLDIIWIVDNSGSMEDEQAKLRSGFVSFAQRYMKPTWDIRLAVITTDTFLAHPALSNYRDATVGSTASYVSNYVNGVTTTGRPGRVNPLNNPNPPWHNGLFVWDSSTSKWKMKSTGVTRRQFRPNYSGNWAKLLDSDPATGKGNHDGPPVSLCNERSISSFYDGDTNCEKRDNISRVSPPVNTGIDHCVTPSTGEAAVSQCVNTPMNDSVHSGKSVISTYGVAEQDLINQFLVNVSVGIAGEGAEQGINSLLQLISDNEANASPTKFFRKDALRVIVIVSDEEDISVVYPTSGTQVTPTQYHSSGTICRKTVDGYTYQISTCPNPSLTYPANGSAWPINEVKNRLDTFFRTLDGNPEGNPNYFIAVITALTASSVQQSGDQATRDIQLANAVGNGSMTLEINSTDYSPLLDAIGAVVVQKKGIFTLTRAPTGEEDMLVKIRHENGSETIVSPDKYEVSGKTLTITDDDVILGLAATDVFIINYQPRTIY
jgi:hypothetical protein